MKPVERIAVIDDEPISQELIRLSIKNIFEIKEYLSFCDAGKALAFFEENKDDASRLRDLVFLDLVMPIVSGMEFLSRFEVLKPVLAKACRIYVMTASISNEDYERVIQSPLVTQYIVKPVSRDNLKEIFASFSSTPNYE